MIYLVSVTVSYMIQHKIVPVLFKTVAVTLSQYKMPAFGS